MNSYLVTIEDGFYITRSVNIKAKSAMDAHKQVLFSELNEDEEIKTIKNSSGELVYGANGFVVEV